MVEKKQLQIRIQQKVFLKIPLHTGPHQHTH